MEENVEGLINEINQLKESDPEKYKSIIEGLGLTIEKQGDDEGDDKDKDTPVEKSKKQKVNKQDGGEGGETDVLERLENIIDEGTMAGVEEIAKSNEIDLTGATNFSKTINGLAAIAKAHDAINKAHDNSIVEIKKAIEGLASATGVAKQVEAIEGQKEEDEKKKKEEQEKIEKSNRNKEFSEMFAIAVKQMGGNSQISNETISQLNQVVNKSEPAADIDSDFINKLKVFSAQKRAKGGVS